MTPTPRAKSDANTASGLGIDVRALLDRPEIVVDPAAADESLKDRVVFVTGAAGSIGGAIARRVVERGPRALVLIDRSENELYRLEQELEERARGVTLVPVLMDVLDRRGIGELHARFRPATEFHAAAYKHVSVLERHPAEAVRNNVAGTLNVAEAALASGVARFIFVSTDKAIRPSSVMGATKRAGEILLQALACRAPGGTQFITVRFGNVLDSSGNVVERFSHQIARGGPVTVTHPDMSRYFMTAAEAVGLVLEASGLGRSGDVFLLDIGRPQRIMDLALRMIRLAGSQAGREVSICVSEPRPGEKLEEDYRLPGMGLWATTTPHVLRAEVPSVDPERVRAMVADLLDLAERGTAEEVRARLACLVEDYQPGAPVLPSPD